MGVRPWCDLARRRTIPADVRALARVPPEPLREHSIWRCMAGKVYACTFGANLPCQEKADTRRSPTSAMTAFCRDEPDADAIPMVVTGRATVYAWRCEQGASAILRQITRPDASGYLANVW